MKINAEGIANISSSGETLDIYFPSIIFGEKAILNEVPEIDNASKKLIKVNWNEHDLNRCIESIDDAYLKLHLISYKFVPPNTVNLDGLFDVLPNVAWTNRGPISINEVRKCIMQKLIIMIYTSNL